MSITDVSKNTDEYNHLDIRGNKRIKQLGNKGNVTVITGHLISLREGITVTNINRVSIIAVSTCHSLHPL